jgi:chromosomal replication initiator protein
MAELKSLTKGLSRYASNYPTKEEHIISQIFIHIEEVLGIPEVAIKSKDRAGDIVHARFIAIYLIYMYMEGAITLKNIGVLFGNRDHSTIINAKEKVIETTIKTDPKFYKKLNLFNIY